MDSVDLTAKLDKLSELEKVIKNALVNFKGKVSQSNLIQWERFFNKVKNSNLTEEEKAIKYQILINTIEAFDNALYKNSTLVIVRDSLINTFKEIGDVTLTLAENLSNPFSLVAIAIIFIGVIFLYVRKR